LSSTVENPHKIKGHYIHVPVMGTSFTLDAALRVAPYGIHSVASLVDDILCERVGEYYAKEFNLPYEIADKKDPEARAKRTTAYLNLLNVIVDQKFKDLQESGFEEGTEKAKYFDLLPLNCTLKQDYLRIMALPEGSAKEEELKLLTEDMVKGFIDVNIMVKLDPTKKKLMKFPNPEKLSDAMTALKGYAVSDLNSRIIYSAGINKKLFKYMQEFPDFYRQNKAKPKKGIIVKVSDYRSAMIQGKFLARIGLEVDEFRIESGLNCGGHVFPTQGDLLPDILNEFKENRSKLREMFYPLIEKYYQAKGWVLLAIEEMPEAIVTLQGGIGNHGEMERLRDTYDIHKFGIGTPFLLVPEVTSLDDTTRQELVRAREKDLFVSLASPLGIGFNNLRKSGSEKDREAHIAEGRPGSNCPKGLLQFNTEFTETPICLASKAYQKKKLISIEESGIEGREKEKAITYVISKSCICDQLGNSILIKLGIEEETNAPQAICPGPNMAWFNKIYSLKEMLGHFYGTGANLVMKGRPHMIAEEARLYMDLFREKLADLTGAPEDDKWLKTFSTNLIRGLRGFNSIVSGDFREDENKLSIAEYAKKYIAEIEKHFPSLVEVAPA